jgi:hypothetical protein
LALPWHRAGHPAGLRPCAARNGTTTAGEPRTTADARVIELHVDGEEWLLLLQGTLLLVVVLQGDGRRRLLEVDAAAMLVGLRALEGGDERVGERRAGLDRAALAWRSWRPSPFVVAQEGGLR